MFKRIAAVAVFAALLLGASPAAAGRAGGQRPLASGVLTYEQIDSPVEGYQFLVQNVGYLGQTYLWDTDDHITAGGGTGYLDAGAEAVTFARFMAMPNPTFVGGGGSSLHPNWHLVVQADPAIQASICFPVQQLCVPVDGDTCTAGPMYQTGAPSLQVIPGTGGGFAVPSLVEFHVKNPTNRRVRNITTYLEGGNDHDACWGLPEARIDRPEWSVVVK
jgi:hypothetical protein